MKTNIFSIRAPDLNSLVEGGHLYWGFSFSKGSLYQGYGLFTLAKFVSETVSDSDMKQYLPWPPWAMQRRIISIYVAMPKVAKASK
jgi:hypothetical protein